MLDRYIFGSVERISPEAPVPVVDVCRDEQVLGGAANVAANLASLGAEVTLLGLVGADSAADELRDLLEIRGIDTGALLVDESRPTTVKTRVIAGQQQVVRVDRERRGPASVSVQEAMVSRLAERMASVDAVLVSDYGKGVVQPALLDHLRALRRHSQVPVVVDPKDIHFSNYREFTLVTPNKMEASLAVGFKFQCEEDVLRAGEKLRQDTQLKHLLITRGAEGMTLFSETGATHISTMAREVYDVSGAGDTVAATMALSLAAGTPAIHGAHLANAAAAVVVAHVGTAIVEREALVKSLNAIEGPAEEPKETT
jgi:D-beta-D-heptose 7-phosphate kinase/D-beta-D-heptose 1-phosphate adenosyltransferase